MSFATEGQCGSVALTWLEYDFLSKESVISKNITCSWPVLWPQSILMSMVRPCCLQRPYRCEWSSLLPEDNVQAATEGHVCVREVLLQLGLS